MIGYEPSSYPAISITGGTCWLLCEYCKGRWLRGMIKAWSIDEFERLVERLVEKGVRGILVSGGFTPEGRLPLTERHLAVMKRARRKGVVISVHTGYVGSKKLAEMLVDAVDIIDYEIPVSEMQLKMMHLHNRSVDMYIEDAAMLAEYGLRVVPHLLLNLPSVPSTDEAQTVLRVSSIRMFDEIVLLSYVPLKRTEVRYSVLRIVEAARLARIHGIRRVKLGCMKPSDLDETVMGAGYLHLFYSLVRPSRHVRPSLIRIYDTCCSFNPEPR